MDFAELRDPVAWQQKIRDAKPEEKVSVCKEALEIWPAATEIWLTLVKHSSDPGKELAKCLPLSIDPKLFETYLQHIRTTKPEDLGAAYEYVLEQISFHPDSGPIWKAYIDWLGSQPAANDWEETFRRDRVRKAYKRAVTLPVSNIEALWKSYGQFETKISRVSARKFIDERSAAYMKARSAYKTTVSLLNGVNLSTMPSTESSRTDEQGWINYIEWVRTNPLELEDSAEAAKQVHFAFIRATQCCRWSPRLWFDAGSKDDPKFWEQGAKAMPESYLVAYRLAEHYEALKEYEQAEQALTRLITFLSQHGNDSTLGWVELVKCTHRMRGVEAAREIVQRAVTEVAEPGPELYIAAANVERGAANPVLMDKIWEFAFSKFAHDRLFVSRYISYLFEQHDVLNARSVFEQAVAGAGAVDDRELWDRMLALEGKHAQETDSSLSVLRELESRYLQKFSGHDEVSLFMQRFGADAPKLFGTTAPTRLDSTEPTLTAPTSAANGGPGTGATKTKGPLMQLIADLPPASVYDGPIVNGQLLLQLVLSNT